LVNDDVEMLGAAELPPLELDVLELLPPLAPDALLELLEDELPHPAATTAATATTVHTRKRLKPITARSSQIARKR
jgi:hypothetical protein